MALGDSGKGMLVGVFRLETVASSSRGCCALVYPKYFTTKQLIKVHGYFCFIIN